MQRRELGFGEAFMNTGNLLKPFDTLTALRGCKINFFGGGNNKAFVVYEDQSQSQKIIPLHPAEIDQYDYTISDGQDTENYMLTATEHDAEKVDMETFAVLRAAQHFGLPMIGLRGISDGAADLSHIGDWTEYLHVIDEKLARAVDRLAQALGSGDVAL